MKRRLLRLASLSSFLLCVLCILALLLSPKDLGAYWRNNINQIIRSEPDHNPEITIRTPPRWQLSCQASPRGLILLLVREEAEDPVNPNFYDEPFTPESPYGISSGDLEIANFDTPSMLSGGSFNENGPTAWGTLFNRGWYRALRLPYWLAITLFAFLPACMLFAAWQKRRSSLSKTRPLPHLQLRPPRLQIPLPRMRHPRRFQPSRRRRPRHLRRRPARPRRPQRFALTIALFHVVTNRKANG